MCFFKFERTLHILNYFSIFFQVGLQQQFADLDVNYQKRPSRKEDQDKIKAMVGELKKVEEDAHKLKATDEVHFSKLCKYECNKNVRHWPSSAAYRRNSIKPAEVHLQRSYWSKFFGVANPLE